MTLRDHFAGEALGGMLGNVCNEHDRKTIRTNQKIVAEYAYKLADAMLIERMKGGAK
jgi:hypothetical protein